MQIKDVNVLFSKIIPCSANITTVWRHPVSAAASLGHYPNSSRRKPDQEVESKGKSF